MYKRRRRGTLARPGREEPALTPDVEVMSLMPDVFEARGLARVTAARPAAFAVALLLVAALASCRRASPPAPTAPPARAVAPSPAASGAQEVTATTALEAFARLYGPVPGVAVTTQHAGFGCGTEAVRWVAAHWSSLRPEQQAAVRSALESPPPRSALRDLSSFVSRAAAAQAGACCGAAAPPAAEPLTEAQQANAQRIVDGLRAELVTLLGHTPRMAFKVYREAPGAPADAVPMRIDSERVPYWISGMTDDAPLSSASVCRVRVRREWLEGRSPEALRMVLGHEIFHCFQYDLFAGTRGDQLLAFDHLRPWAFEGAAAYVGERLSRGTTLDGCWLRGYFSPTPATQCVAYSLHRSNHPAGPGVFSLYRAGYDAIGFFSTLESLGVDPLARGAGGVANLLRAVNDESADAALARISRFEYARLVDVASASTRRGWSSSWRIDSPLVQTGDGMSRGAPPIPPVVHGAPAHLVLESGAMQVVEVPFGDARFVRVQGRGHGHVAFDASLDRIYVSDANMVFCREWPCMCPDGRPVPHATGQIPAASSRFTLAHFAVPRETADVTLDAPTVDELCGATPPDPSPPPPTGIDPCLTGTWHIDRAHELEAMRASFPAQVRVRNIRGDLQLRFDGRGGGGALFNNYCVETESGTTPPLQQRVIFNGQGTGRYAAANGRLSTRDFVPALDVRAEVTVAGQRMNIPVPVNDAIARAAVPGAEAYTCSANELRFRDARATRYLR